MNDNTVTTPIRYIGNGPLDVKVSPVDTIDSLYSIPMNERYYGMTKYVTSEKKEYWLKDNLANAGWVEKKAEQEEDAGILITGSDVEE